MTLLVQRIHTAFQERLGSSRGPRVLMVVADLEASGRAEDAIRLANALVDRLPVFLCNASQSKLDPEIAARVEPRVVLIEGTLGETLWTCREDLDGDHLEAVSRTRAEVLRELIGFHGIDVIYSHGWWADRLVYKVRQGLDLPWFIDLRNRGGHLEINSENDPLFDQLIAPMMMTSRGAFYARAEDLRMFAEMSVPRPEHLIRIDDHPEVTDPSPAGNCSSSSLTERLVECDQIATLVTETFAAAVSPSGLPKSSACPRNGAVEREGLRMPQSA
jgi:hypothetical protein